MPKYLLAYRGGAQPEGMTAEEVGQVMAAWQAWMQGIGEAFVDPGNPLGIQKTITAGGTVSEGGGAEALSGYGLLEAPDMEAAIAMAKGCPIFESGGTITVAETLEM
jgi:hypothetical protein